MSAAARLTASLPSCARGGGPRRPHSGSFTIRERAVTVKPLLFLDECAPVPNNQIQFNSRSVRLVLDLDRIILGLIGLQHLRCLNVPL